jgi:hypothetical protein
MRGVFVLGLHSPSAAQVEIPVQARNRVFCQSPFFFKLVNFSLLELSKTKTSLFSILTKAQCPLAFRVGKKGAVGSLLGMAGVCACKYPDKIHTQAKQPNTRAKDAHTKKTYADWNITLFFEY